jgi:hypothetical protein
MKHASFLLFMALIIIMFSCKTPETNSICVALAKMNVLYRGVDNPADIVVSGKAMQDMKVTIDNGTIKIANGTYLINPAKLGNALVSVLVKDKMIGSYQFRVKDLPDPVAKINGHKSAIVEKAWLVTATSLSVELENSDFDYNFAIVSFVVSANIPGFKVEKMAQGDKITADQINLIKSVKAGEKVMIEDIKVLGPEGTPRILAPLVFTVK